MIPRYVPMRKPPDTLRLLTTDDRHSYSTLHDHVWFSPAAPSFHVKAMRTMFDMPDLGMISSAILLPIAT